MEDAYKKQLMEEAEAIILAMLSGAVEWVSREQAAAMVDLSFETIERRGIPWDDTVGYIESRVRFEHQGGDTGKLRDRLYYAPDVLLLLKTPATKGRSRKMKRVVAPRAF